MLTIRLLGEMEVLCDGERQELPPSRKTRALLALLVATGRPHRRERLCELFWDIPDDPRGALRWSLSKLRGLVDEPDRPRIIAERETVAFSQQGASVDLLLLREIMSEPLDAAPLGRLKEAAAIARGEFLEGLEAPGQPGFAAWCAAEREEVRRARMAVLSALIERLETNDLAGALPHARALVALDPLAEAPRAKLLRLLIASGRPDEAETHYRSGLSLLDEAGLPAPELRQTWRDLHPPRAARPAAPPPLEPELTADVQPPAQGPPRARLPARLPTAPSIAVLPFENMSGDPEQEYFGDGISEEIITALSRVRWFPVVARNSSFRYKNQSVDVREMGQELGVRYVLEGSVRRSGSRVRIVAQLIDTDSNVHIWAERYDGTLEDVFDLQDRITESVVTAIEPQIRIAELDRTRRKRPENLTAYDCFLRGMALFWMSGFESAENTLALFRRAIESDPGFAPPYALAAQCYVYRVSQGVSPDSEAEAAAGAEMARAAIDRGAEDPTVLALGAHALGHLTNEYDMALALMDRALALNPNSAMAWQLAGWMSNWVGDAERAIDRLQRSQRLSPLDMRAFVVHSGLATAHIMLGQYETAIEAARKAIAQAPHWHTGYRMLAAALAHTGRLEEARAAAARQLQLNPGYDLRLVRRIFKPSAGREILIEGLRRAGIPE